MNPGPIRNRPLPVETVDGLRPPLAGYPYLEGADRFPLDPGARGYSAANASWLADASFLVYGDAPFVEAAIGESPLPGLGFAVDWLGTTEDNRGFVLASDTDLVIVFRGTRQRVHTILDRAEVVLLDQDDLRVDGRFLPVACRTGGRVHSGFLSAYSEVADRVQALANDRRPGQSLWLAGHSLGGALATLAAAHVGSRAIAGLYTFGAPRVGDATFARALPPACNHRLVHRDDWVPTLPPTWLGYEHAGGFRPVVGMGPRPLWDDVLASARDLAAALESMGRDALPSNRSLPFRMGGLADHAPAYYATLLWNELILSPSFSTSE